MNITIEQVAKARNGSTARYVVRGQSGQALGLLEKFNNTRTERHPWKAFRGIGMSCQFLGSFYPEEGGKAAALRAILGETAEISLKVVSLSSNTNGFGLTGVVLLASDGRAWEVGHCQHPRPWEKGQTIHFLCDPLGRPIFVGCEIPRQLPAAPAAVVNEVWGKK